MAWYRPNDKVTGLPTRCGPENQGMCRRVRLTVGLGVIALYRRIRTTARVPECKNLNVITPNTIVDVIANPSEMPGA